MGVKGTDLAKIEIKLAGCIKLDRLRWSSSLQYHCKAIKRQ